MLMLTENKEKRLERLKSLKCHLPRCKCQAQNWIDCDVKLPTVVCRCICELVFILLENAVLCLCNGVDGSPPESVRKEQRL